VPAAPPPESPAASVEEALQKAQVALAAAESHLSSIETLQPQLSTRWAKALQVVKLLALAAATGGLLVTSHAFGLTWQWVSAVAAGVGVAGEAPATQLSVAMWAGVPAAHSAFRVLHLLPAWFSACCRRVARLNSPRLRCNHPCNAAGHAYTKQPLTCCTSPGTMLGSATACCVSLSSSRLALPLPL
jgi:hypothetical protein